MLRITRISSNGCDTLKLEGRVAGKPVEELRQLAEECLRQRSDLGLDLSAVSYMDPEGASLLRDLVDRQVKVVSSSSFVAELLRRRIS